MKSSRRLLALACMAGLLASGCNLLSYPLFLMAPEPVEQVPAEFSRLEGKTAAIVIWTEPATLYQFPHMRMELASQVAYQLNQRVRSVQVVPPQQVAQFQERNLNWETVPPSEIGRQFGADYVLFVELLEYSTRDPKTPGLFRGQARASVVVHDVQDPSMRWALTPIAVRYPEGNDALIRGDDMGVHRQLLEMLGSRVAMKFYDHEVSKDRPGAKVSG